jgi:hypothetical protein
MLSDGSGSVSAAHRKFLSARSLPLVNIAKNIELLLKQAGKVFILRVVGQAHRLHAQILLNKTLNEILL